jgi:thymidylate synthase
MLQREREVKSGLFIEAKDIEDAWHQLLVEVWETGWKVNDERGSLTLERLNSFVVIKNPKRIIPRGCSFSEAMILEYENQLLNPDKGTFVYTYGNRLRAAFGLDQIVEAIKHLNECNESRRTISVTWKPEIDAYAEDVPCMIYVDLKIRDGRLFTTAMWRSHDLFGAYPQNLLALRKLSEYVAGQVGVEMGEITVHSISLHIYEVNFEEARGVVNAKKYGQSTDRIKGIPKRRIKQGQN